MTDAPVEHATAVEATNSDTMANADTMATVDATATAYATDTADATDTTVVTFYSFKGGSGRTMAVANVAWILASMGKRVLTVDWDLESPGLHRYFRPFLTDKDLTASAGVIDMLLGYVRATQRAGADADGDTLRARFTDFSDHVRTLDWPDFPGEGRIDFLGAGRQTEQYTVDVTTFPWSWLFEDVNANGDDFIDALRGRMRTAGYDYVLLDSRTGISDVAGICTQMLPDTVVLCFALNNQAVEGGARMADIIRAEAERPVRVIPVPMRVEDGELRKLQRRRRYAQQQLRAPLGEIVGDDDDAQLRFLVHHEVPYQEFYAYEEQLAIFGDMPGSRRGLLAAYEEVGKAVTGAAHIELPVVREIARERVLRQFEEVRQAPPRAAVVLGAAQDRAWVDWVAARLRGGGVRIRSAAGDPPTGSARDGVDAVAVVVSPHLAAAASHHQVARWLEWAADAGVTVRAVRVAEGSLDDRYSDLDTVSLTARGEDEAGEAFAAAFGLAAVTEPSQGPRFPARRPRTWSLAHQNPWFVGRSQALDAIRDRLGSGRPSDALCPVVGEPGLGKSELAREYAHRFRADYDVVWWVPAGQPATVRMGLGQLGRELRTVAAGPATPLSAQGTDDVHYALDSLRRGEPFRRWLLIYDDAGSPQAMDDLLPEASDLGHVLVTSRDGSWAERAHPVVVRPFTRAESIGYLRLRLPDSHDRGLEAVATQLDDNPLELASAAGWLRQQGVAADEYVDHLRARAETAASAVPAWAHSFAELENSDKHEQRAAARLLRLCSLLADEGIAVALLSSPAMMREVAGEPSGDRPQRPVHPGDLLPVIEKYSLAEVDSRHSLVRLHRLQQEYLRGLMTAGEEREARAAVLRVLAAYAPNQARSGDPQARPIHVELQKHVEPSGAADSDDPGVREWLVGQVGFLWWIGEWDAARLLGERCLKRWRDVASIGPDDPLTLRLSAHLADALRSLGRFSAAFDLDEDTLARQRMVLGLHDRATLATAAGLGADKRSLGWFRDAYAEDQATLAGYRKLLGDDDPSTLAAANNLALSLFLAGDVRQALALNRDVFQRRCRVLGEGHAQTLWSQCRLAICQRELGEYDGVQRLLRTAAEGIEKAYGPDAHFTLRTRKHLGVALRRMGEVPAAAHQHEQLLARFRRSYGDRDPGTLACQLSLAGARAELGDSAQAVRLGEACLRGYLDLYGEEHPYTNVCRTNLAAYLRGAGDLARAVKVAEQAWDDQLDQLYEAHPFTIGAAVNLANCLVELGEPNALKRALELDTATVAECPVLLGPNHPYSRTARDNLLDSSARASGVSGRPRADVDIDISTI